MGKRTCDNNPTMRPQREFTFDLLRVGAAFGVICIHVSSVVISHPPASGWQTGNFFYAFCRWCVPAFVMISGAFLLDNPSPVDPLTFYRKKAFRLLLPILFWTAVYLPVLCCQYPDFNLRYFHHNIMQGNTFYHLWFLYMMVGLYLFTPFIHAFTAASSRHTQKMFVIIYFAVSSIECMYGVLVDRGGSATFLWQFHPYIAYFIAGHLLRHYRTVVPCWIWWSAACLCGVLIAAGVDALLPHFGMKKATEIMYQNFNPLAILMTLFIFIGTTQFSFFATRPCQRGRRWISRLAPVALGIYVIHPMWLILLEKWNLRGTAMHPIVGIPLTTMVAFILSSFSALAISRIPFLGRIVK